MGRFAGWMWVSALAVCAFSVFGVAAQAQPNSGSIEGIVADPSGVAIAGAEVTATNVDTALQVLRTTDKSGHYSIPVPPGPYIVEVIAKGYRHLLQQNVAVPFSEQAQSVVFNPKLTPGGPWGTLRRIPPCLNRKSYLPPGVVMGPLFRDPLHDGAADPVVVWDRADKQWMMFYTNRRADLDDNNGVTWVHGTHIGLARSCDGGELWDYLGEADIPLPAPDYTLWAPEIIDTGGLYHMFLTVVPGTFTDWNHPRHILHLTSKDLLHWKPLENANLESDRTIDACVFKLPDGSWRLWYKNEADSSKVYFSDSPNLVHWTPKGVATTNHGEGPVVFQWHGAYWLINDPHTGLAVFRSDDLTTWKQQPDNLLRVPGIHPTDRAVGNHPDVVVDATGRAWLFYFTQQGGEDRDPSAPGSQRRSVLHVTELHEKDGILTVDRNAPAYIHMLPPPQNKKSDLAKAW